MTNMKILTLAQCNQFNLSINLKSKVNLQRYSSPPMLQMSVVAVVNNTFVTRGHITRRKALKLHRGNN